jgi:serine phosphatase RsbU (regulator of sigma subunit)
MQAILINIAIADRINFLQQDQLAAREEALSKEKLAREAQERFNEKLECQVRERTSELNVAVDELKRKEEIVQRELDLAADIQKGILPAESFNFNGIRIEAFYGALEKIGGDFYDYFPVKGDHLCVLISDVSGHGIPASFVTTIAKIYFSEGAARSVFPKDIFRFVNDSLLKTVKTQEYLSAFITVIGPSYEVYYSNASHQKIFRLRKSDREIEEWDTNGLFLGAIAQANELYEDKSDYLDYGDRLVFYTDGIVEARNSDDVEFGTSRLKELVLKSASMPLADAKAYIVKKFYEFTGDVPLRDDFSFILLEIDSNYRRLLEHKSAGLDHMYHRDYDSAVRQFKIAEEIDPQNESLKLLLGKCFYRMRGFDSAAAYLKAYLERNPEDADSWSMLAASLFNLKDYEEAIEAAKMGCHLRPNFIKALQVMAYSYKKTGRDAESAAVWESIIRIDPQNITAIAELEGLKTGRDSQEQP